MSKVKIKGNSSGNGVLTIEAPNTNTDSTITLPDGDVTLGVGIDDNATSTAITISSDENVGIGVTPDSGWTATNSKALQIGTQGSLWGNNGGSKGIAVSDNMYWDNANMRYITTDQASQHYQSAGSHYFRVAPSGTADSAISWTTAMTIENDGDVVHGTVGTGNPYWKLQANGSVDLSCDITSNRDLISFRNPNGQVGSVRTNGSATSYLTSSDYRLKENVTPLTGSIDRLKELKPSKFNFKADADTTVDGFLAHEAQEVVPEAISGEKDAMRTEEYEVEPAVMDGETEVTPAIMGEREVEDYQGIDQSKLVPLLTSALQEAVAKIEDLEKRIEILEAK